MSDGAKLSLGVIGGCVVAFAVMTVVFLFLKGF